MTQAEEIEVLKSKISLLVTQVIANHEWHLNYDEYDGYLNSTLFDDNMEALSYAALNAGSFSDVMDKLAELKQKRPTLIDRIIDRFFTFCGVKSTY